MCRGCSNWMFREQSDMPSPDPSLVSRSHRMLGAAGSRSPAQKSRNESGNGRYDLRQVRVLEQQIYRGSQAGQVVIIEAGQ